IARARFGQRVDRLVGTVDVGLVVLVVMQLHDLAANVRLEGRVVVEQRRKRVLGHDAPVAGFSLVEFARRGPRLEGGETRRPRRFPMALTITDDECAALEQALGYYIPQLR